MIKMRLADLTNLQQHLLFWSLYAIYFYTVNVLGNEDVTIGLVVFSLPYFAFVFYVVLFVLTRFLRTKQYIRCAIALLLFYSLSSVMVWGLTYGDWPIGTLFDTYKVDEYEFSWAEFIQMSMLMHCQFSILAFLYYHYRGKLAKERQRVAEMMKRMHVEEEKRRYEYVALSAQVSPHMMGNIFQGWSRQLRQLVPAIADEMDNVYNLMKFYMNAHDPDAGETILLEDEVQAVRHFLIAQKAIFERDFYVEWDVRGSLLRFSIPPTTLLTLVKNAFKHGDIYAEDTPLHIAIAVGQSDYTLTVANRKREGAATLDSHGIGLRNLRRRLDLVYGKRAHLESSVTEDMYRVALHVDFTPGNLR